MVYVLIILSNDIDNAGSDEPRTLRKAIKRPDQKYWLAAIILEIDLLAENQVQELINTPPGAKILTGRQVFKLKKDRHGNILKYKARQVVYGYKQQYSVDYKETFAAVAKPISWKALLAFAVLRQDMEINQIDIVTAFLYGFLDKVIYIEQPHMLADRTTKVCKLIKTLYSLKQSPRIQYETLADFLKKLGLYPSELDPIVFITDIKDLFLSIYIDDLLIFSANRSKIESLKVELSNRFKITDLGPILYYLGIEVDITDNSIIIR